MHASVNAGGLDAILPAGSRISGGFAERAGTDMKALIRIGEASLLERLISAIRSVDCIRRVVVVGPEEVTTQAAKLADIVLPEGTSGPENILRGIEWLNEQAGGKAASRVLILTADLPFVEAADISSFLDACRPDVDLCVPLIGMPDFVKRFPGSVNVGVRLRDGEWTIGCAFLANPAVLIANRERIERVFAARKSQFAMASLLGLPFIIRFLTRRLTIEQIERRCSELLGCGSGAVRGCSPALAFDIDCQGDYEYVLGYLIGQGS